MLGLRRLSERLGLRPTPLGRFIKLTAASGLVTPDNLASALNEFRRTKVASGTDEQTVAAFSNYLVDIVESLRGGSATSCGTDDTRASTSMSLDFLPTCVMNGNALSI